MYIFQFIRMFYTQNVLHLWKYLRSLKYFCYKLFLFVPLIHLELGSCVYIYIYIFCLAYVCGCVDVLVLATYWKPKYSLYYQSEDILANPQLHGLFES